MHCTQAHFTGWVACRFQTPVRHQAAGTGSTTAAAAAAAADAVWVRSKAKARLCLDVASRTVSLEVSGVDLLAGCTSLAYTWVPSSATGNSGCLVLQAAADDCAVRGRQAQRPQAPQGAMLLVYKFDMEAAGDECSQLLQALLPQEPQQHLASAGRAMSPAENTAQQDTADQDWLSAQQAIQRYLLDDEFQEYVNKVEDAWDELEADAALAAL